MKLIEKMPRVCKAIIKAKGATLKNLKCKTGLFKGAHTLEQYNCRMPHLEAYSSDIAATSPCFAVINERDPMRAPANRRLSIGKASAHLPRAITFFSFLHLHSHMRACLLQDKINFMYPKRLSLKKYN